MRIVLLLAFAGGVFAQQASPPASDPAMQTLLNEVHALRLAIEQSNRIGPAIQIAIAQMHTMDERMSIATKQLQDARDKIAESNSRKTSLQSAIKRDEDQVARAVDPNIKKRAEDDLASFQAILDNQAAIDQALQAKEADANAQFLAEQARWNEASDKLKMLERMLTQPQQ